MLTVEEIDAFSTNGFAGPFELWSAAEMRRRAELVEARVCASDGPFERDRWESRHQDCRCVFDLCAAEAIIGRVRCLLGPHVLLWNSVFFCKQPGGREVPWHQDRDFLLLDPPVNVAAWLAMDDATAQNGCLDVIPGSHRVQVPHVPRQTANQFIARADLQYVNRESAIPLPLRAGQFILFHRDLLHHSRANLSLHRRLGLVIRYTTPGVRVNTQGLFREHRVYLMSGEDADPVAVHGQPPAD
jgi:ectoine hydroxylase-related dioxygenase (phytanoyl-CoA dioxygenase family)